VRFGVLIGFRRASFAVQLQNTVFACSSVFCLVQRDLLLGHPSSLSLQDPTLTLTLFISVAE